MLRNVFGAIAGVVIIAAATAAPTLAADDTETKAQVCSTCHGQNGQPIDPKTIPIISGQQSNYLFKELHDFRSGARTSPIMSPLVKTTSFEDLRALANYFAAKTWPANQPAGAASPPEGIAMCRACHGPNFEGGAPAPRLAGLSYEYLVAAMNSFADGKRTNNLDMPGFMQALTAEQRNAMARYLSSL